LNPSGRFRDKRGAGLPVEAVAVEKRSIFDHRYFDVLTVLSREGPPSAALAT
jgi:hypothetical protein